MQCVLPGLQHRMLERDGFGLRNARAHRRKPGSWRGRRSSARIPDGCRRLWQPRAIAKPATMDIAPWQRSMTGALPWSTATSIENADAWGMPLELVHLRQPTVVPGGGLVQGAASVGDALVCGVRGLRGDHGVLRNTADINAGTDSKIRPVTAKPGFGRCHALIMETQEEVPLRIELAARP